MSKKRPGVEAAVRLAKSGNVECWNQILDANHHGDVLGRIQKLPKLHEDAQRLGDEFRNGTKCSITKSELLEIVIPWKFAVGKPRNALLGLLRSNSESAVLEATKAGIAQAQSICSADEKDLDSSNIKAAMDSITTLKGVGPATASAILSLVRPDIFSYMYDEVIDCFMPKRTYELKVYMACNAECLDLSRQLGEPWTPAKVATTLWVAARVKAMGITTATKSQQRSAVDKRKAKAPLSVEEPAAVVSKRRRRK